MKPVFRANLFALLIVVLQIVIGLTFAIFRITEKVGYTSIMAVDEYLFLLIPVIIYVLVTKVPVKQTFRLNKISIEDIGIVVLIAFLSQPLASFLSLVTGFFFSNPVDEAFNIMGRIPFLLQLFIIAITPAICEEAVMRGVILSGYKNVVRWKAALMNGLIFGILHLSGQQFLYAFALGIIFSYLVNITNSIFASSICHFTFNAIQVTLARFEMKALGEKAFKESSRASLSIGQQLGTAIVMFVLAAIFTTLIVMLIRYMQSKNTRRTVQMTAVQGAFEENNEMAYMFRATEGSDVTIKERVINIPFIILLVIYIAWIAFELVMSA